MTSLLDQCHEVLHDILSYLNPEDLGRLSSTCTALQSYVGTNRLLWKTIYLNHCDDPRIQKPDVEPNWEDELKDITAATQILRSKSKEIKTDNLELVATQIVRLIKQAQPEYEASKNIKLLKSQLKGLNVETFALNSNLFHAARGDDTNVTQRLSNLVAQVHCLLGTTYDNLRYDPDIRSYLKAAISDNSTKLRVHPFARSQVYDMRLCSLETRWGPWSHDGKLSVDWQRVECLMIDLAYNVNSLAHHSHSFIEGLWKKPFKGTQKGSYIDSFPRSSQDEINEQEDLKDCSSSDLSWSLDAIRQQPEPPPDSLDPFGVTGTWQRIVCFLDYGDFHSVNFPRRQSMSERRPPIHHDEAIRLILMRLQVTKVEPRSDSPLPMVHFQGTSRSMHSGWDPNASSRIQGSVSLTPENEVRWSTLSLFQGEARWRSEAVQIGGPRSGRGVIGSWFEKDMDSNGPMGPTASWKLTDRTEKGKNSLTWRRGADGIRLSFDGQEADPPVGIEQLLEDDDDDDENEDGDWEEDEREGIEEDEVVHLNEADRGNELEELNAEELEHLLLHSPEAQRALGRVLGRLGAYRAFES